ncbi:uncharacterized protein PHACADRAFT_195957 [Phanerochaete carnosa HHB-10118-sp]|uniref:Uncharacterized protein n=1 Tax=Phanerochaete carnosa (strain HHB-10118-sp) TaxID=650164 RepID=K5VWI1_PHACS|nr:uncharacterized protein PHACADRAFT_195957 [Phanerochaete carnosa HHB-10118-sp]EKM55903.1 hypothetical protein PHACADRAFT_195957 [Phanerochaete carnosa HHB-10118-sp]
MLQFFGWFYHANPSQRHSVEDVVTIGTPCLNRSFVCTKDVGAVLLLLQGAALVKLTEQAQHRLHDYCVKHIRNWVLYLHERSKRWEDKYAQEYVQDLLIITGSVLSSTWALGVYMKKYPLDPDRPWIYFPFCCHKDCLNPLVVKHARPNGPEYYGPYARDVSMLLLEIHFKLRRSVRDIHIPRIEGLNAPQHLDIDTGGWESNCHDAVEEILNYILKYLSAKVAVTGTRDLRALLSCMPTPPSPESFTKSLKRLRSKIIVDDEKVTVGSVDIESSNDTVGK